MVSKFSFCSLLILVVLVSMQDCASPLSPTGGPKDTIPPTLISSIPKNGEVLYKSNKIVLEFSELVDASQLKKHLIISPKTNNKYTYIAKNNRIVLSFDEPFPDSTTVYMNFLEGIVDITEKNPVENLALAFSTSTFIDSMAVSGIIEDLFTKEVKGKITVGLYTLNDTFDILKEKPTYISSSSDSGLFNFQYIKSGDYKLVAIEDENKNLLIDAEKESYGFVSKNISLTERQPHYEDTVRLIKFDIRPLRVISKRPNGSYFELKFNKPITSYSISTKSDINSLSFNLPFNEKEIIRFYKTEALKTKQSDTIEVYISAKDTAVNIVTDTSLVYFIDSKKKKKKFEFKSYFIHNSIDSLQTKIIFSKPILSFNPDSILIVADTFSLSIQPSSITLFNNVTLKIDKLKQLMDSLERNIRIADSIQILLAVRHSTDTTQENLSKFSLNNRSAPNYSINLLKSAFVSIERDTLENQSINIITQKKKETGVLKVKIITSYKSFILQLLDNQGNIILDKKNLLHNTFNINPGKYTLRVLIDNNEDGQWTLGNITKNIEPENVYLYEDEILIRENWENEIEIEVK